MNTRATPFIFDLHRFNGHSNNPPKKRGLFWTRGDGQEHSCNPKKHRCVCFGARSSLWGGGLYGVDPPCSVTRWKRQITWVPAQLSRALWSGNRRKNSVVKVKGCFIIYYYIISLHSLWEAVNRCRRCLFVKLPHNQKGTWKPCFDVSFRNICLWSVW